jgi:hypothetical protein
MHSIAELLTTPQLAAAVGKPIYSVRYAIRRAGLRPRRRVGVAYLWEPDQVGQVRDALAKVRQLNGMEVTADVHGESRK